jgi:hypothetical protein
VLRAADWSGRVRQRAELHQDECELERTPRSSRWATTRDDLLGRLNREGRVGSAGSGNLRGDALVAHDPVHELEAAQRSGSVATCSNPATSRLCASRASHNATSAVSWRWLGSERGLRLLRIQPCAVAVNQWSKPRPQVVCRE